MAQENLTANPQYAERLRRLSSVSWKRWLNVQAPYRWNIRRLTGTKRVLDVGCGIGRNLNHLHSAVGVDHNPDSIQECRHLGFTAFLPQEFHAWARNQEPFEVLLLSHVVEHMHYADAVSLIQDYLSYLKKDGELILIAPQPKGYESDSTHIEFFNLDKLERLALELGFQATQRYSFPFPKWVGNFFRHNEFVLTARRAL